MLNFDRRIIHGLAVAIFLIVVAIGVVVDGNDQNNNINNFIHQNHQHPNVRSNPSRSVDFVNQGKSRFAVYWIDYDDEEYDDDDEDNENGNEVVQHEENNFISKAAADAPEEQVISEDGGVFPGSHYLVQASVGDEFRIRELPSSSSSSSASISDYTEPSDDADDKGIILPCRQAPDGVCRHVLYTVTEAYNQVVTLHDDPDFRLEVMNHQIHAQQQVQAMTHVCRMQSSSMDPETIDHREHSDDDDVSNSDDGTWMMLQCLQNQTALLLEQLHEDVAVHSHIRQTMATRLENYTCADPALPSSDDILTEEWVHSHSYATTPAIQNYDDNHNNIASSSRNHSTTQSSWGQKNTSYVVHVKHERPASRIHVIEQFVSAEECRAMDEAVTASGKPFMPAHVVDGKGGTRVVVQRKAMQAAIKVDWDDAVEEPNRNGHVIARLSRRVYDYANHVLGLGLNEHGQEHLRSIQYFGRGLNDTEPDQYRPHCDDECIGRLHKIGSRVATMIMYCQVPNRGGATNFAQAAVHIQPVVGDALFFSYLDPQTNVTDSGFTQHSGCPVYEGTKKIVTQWIRYGVDQDNPYHSWNTLAIKKSELDAYDVGYLEKES